MDAENIENDTKTILWMENILSVFRAKTPFSNLSGLVWMGPEPSLGLSQARAICHTLSTLFHE